MIYVHLYRHNCIQIIFGLCLLIRYCSNEQEICPMPRYEAAYSTVRITQIIEQLN